MIPKEIINSYKKFSNIKKNQTLYYALLLIHFTCENEQKLLACTQKLVPYYI